MKYGVGAIELHRGKDVVSPGGKFDAGQRLLSRARSLVKMCRRGTPKKALAAAWEKSAGPKLQLDGLTRISSICMMFRTLLVNYVRQRCTAAAISCGLCSPF